MILVTGGAGYIGSHTVVLLLQAGYEVLILDNLSNSSQIAIERIHKITGIHPKFIKGDIRDASLLKQIFREYIIDAVIHFAGLKSVGESMLKPLEYFDNNIHGSIQLLQAMQDAKVKKLVFSSSATVYGENENSEFIETMLTSMPTNNYGYTKFIVEQMLEKIVLAEPQWAIANLRYFNPIGAHPSGFIGEDPADIPNNLLPYVTQVAIGKLPVLHIYGDDYSTADGTAIRDYIHVMDLARGHLHALHYLKQAKGLHTWNLGTGKGSSVLEVVYAFKKATGIDIPFKVTARREGDIAKCWANADKARNELGWATEYTLEQGLKDAWNWQSKNPNGYKKV